MGECSNPLDDGPGLDVSVVTYAPDRSLLTETLSSLGQALKQALNAGVISGARLTLVDNGPGATDFLITAIEPFAAEAAIEVVIERGHGNVGYGRGHNIAIQAGRSSYHLVLNPDVILEPASLLEAVEHMRLHPEVVLLAPAVTDEGGRTEHLCRRYPSVFDLALRGFAPKWVCWWFTRRLARYAMTDLPPDSVAEGVPIASGAFMFCRGDALRRIGGFDPGFFMYFEDYDLSLRLGTAGGRIDWAPAVRIRHFGGNAARKGLRHLYWFARSAVRFFNRHGWRWR